MFSIEVSEVEVAVSFSQYTFHLEACWSPLMSLQYFAIKRLEIVFLATPLNSSFFRVYVPC